MRLISIDDVQYFQLELMKKLHAFLGANNIRYYLIAGSALGAVRHSGFIPWDDDIDIGMFREDYERFIQLSSSFDGGYDIVNYRNAENCDFGLTRIYFPNTYIDDSAISNTKLDKRLYFDAFPLDNVPDSEDERISYEKKIRQKKILLSRVDVRDYNSKKYALVVKRVYSLVLTPFRQSILRSFDMLMRKYENTDTRFVCSLCSQYSFKKQVMPREVYGEPTLHTFEDVEFYVPEKIDDYLTTLYGADYMKVPPVEKRRKGHDIYVTNED